MASSTLFTTVPFKWRLAVSVRSSLGRKLSTTLRRIEGACNVRMCERLAACHSLPATSLLILGVVVEAMVSVVVATDAVVVAAALNPSSKHLLSKKIIDEVLAFVLLSFFFLPEENNLVSKLDLTLSHNRDEL